MRRPLVVFACLSVVVLATLWILLQTPGSLSAALFHPFYAFLGTQQTLNATLLEVSETADPVLAASRRLLKPFGVVRLIRIYDPGDPDTGKKR